MIRLEGFSFTYAGASSPALADIDLRVGAGEFIGVAGAEGSGRTTLFRVLNGSAPRHFRGVHAGTARVGGLDPCEAGHAELGLFTASIFDDPDAQIVSLTVEEEVGFALVQRGVPLDLVRRRTESALAAVGLSGMERRTTSSLSGGQKQRLVTAAALALEPKLVLLDESAAALDPRGSRELYDLLDGLRRERGTTIVAVEPDLELLMERADRIVVLESGRVAFDGAPESLVFRVPLLERTGVRVPVWLRTVTLLAERGLIEGPPPATEAETAALLSRIARSA